MPETATATPAPAAPPPLSAVERAMAALDDKSEPAAAPPPAPAAEPAQEAAAAPETPKTEPVKAEGKPGEPTVAERFAAMAKRERQMVERDRAIKEREAKLAERKAALKAAEERRAGYAQDPLKALSDMGLTYEDLTKRVLDKTDPSAQQSMAIRQLGEQVEQAKREAAAAKEAIAKAQAEREAAEAERAKAGFKAEVTSHIKANADKYELVSLYGQEGLVYATIEAEYERSGEMLTVDQAAEKVEKYLEAEAEKALKAKKFASKLQPPAPRPAAPTLTNAVTPAPAPAKGKLTEAERFAAAVAALKD